MASANTFHLITLRDNRFTFQAEEFVKILRDSHSSARNAHQRRDPNQEPFAIISVIGDPGSGKSFMLNLINKYLKHNGARGWIGSPDEVLDGFPWSPHLEDRDNEEAEHDHETAGIRMLTALPTIFEAEGDQSHSSGRRFGLQKKVRVILLDIDSHHEKQNNDVEVSKIYAALHSICVHLSSLTIYIETNTKKTGYNPALVLEMVDWLLTSLTSNSNQQIDRKLILKANQGFFNRQHEQIHNTEMEQRSEIGKRSSKFGTSLRQLADEYKFAFAQFDLPSLLKSKGHPPACFQGQPKYLDNNALKLTMSRMVNIDTLLEEEYHRSAEAICQSVEQMLGFLNSVMVTCPSPSCEIIPIVRNLEMVTIEDEGAITDDQAHQDNQDIDDFVAKCITQFANLLRSRWYYFVIPSTRNEAVQITHNHLLQNYCGGHDHGLVGNKLWHMMMNYINRLHPAFRIIDHSYSRMQNELEALIFLSEPEMTALIDQEQKRAAGKLPANGSEEREQLINFFQHCWLTLLNIIKHRNNTISEFEEKINRRAARLVVKFCTDEMARLRENNPHEFTRLAGSFKRTAS